MSSLINVEFIDSSNYISSDSTDVAGVVIDHIWGAVDKIQVLDRTAFYEQYPESGPFGVSVTSVEHLRAWATAHQYLQKGGTYVEVVRPKGNHLYASWEWNETDTDDLLEYKEVTSLDTSDADIQVYWKYPGVLPKSIYPYESFNVKVSVVENIATVSIINEDGTVVESYEGSLVKDAIQDSASYFITDVVASSNIIGISVKGESYDDVELFGEYTGNKDLNVVTEQNITTAYNKYFNNSVNSIATLLLPSYGNNSINSTITAIASERQTLMAFTSYPVSETFDKDSIEAYYQTQTNSMFTAFFAGREIIKVNGMSMIGDCAGSVAGMTAAVAKSVYINQPASAQTYGGFSGTLFASLEFDEVLSLHALGVNSIYNAATGPQIFGIKTTHPRQNSYYSKLNVMRVVAAILKPVLASVQTIIHTPTSSDAGMRHTYQSSLNALLRTFMPNNIKTTSYANLDDNINSDSNTRAGEVLNIELHLYFLKVVEEVNIKVIASDDTVTVEV